MTNLNKEKKGCGIVISECSECKAIYESYFVEGDTHRPHLMQCTRCKSIYYYDEESSHYLKPLSEQIKKMQCAECGESLIKSLKKYTPVKKCLDCGGTLNRKSVSNHEYREFYEIYSKQNKGTE